MGSDARRVVERIEVRIQPSSEEEYRERVRREQAEREHLGVGHPPAWTPPKEPKEPTDRERERGAEDWLREATEGQEEG
jgi:hypothetical protein